MIESIQSIKAAIRKWDQIRNTDLALNFLTSGFGFHLTRAEFYNWSNIANVKNIHLYIGIVEFEIFYFLVDSETDKAGKSDTSVYKVGTNLFIKEFTENANPGLVETAPSKVPEISFCSDGNSNDNSLTEKEAMKRSLRWMLHSQSWFENGRSTAPSATINGQKFEGVLKAMKIPFSDLVILFENDTDRIFAYPALRTDNMKDGEIVTDGSGQDVVNLELILCAHKSKSETILTDVTEQFADVSMPIPPFKATDFNL